MVVRYLERQLYGRTHPTTRDSMSRCYCTAQWEMAAVLQVWE